MQDRFKFRIFEKESKKMFELDAVGYSSFDPFGKGISRLIMIPSGLQNTLHYNKQCLYDNDKFSEPMQCTGLKDKNGKLIYEEDILKEPNGIIDVVYWLNGCYIHNGIAITNHSPCYQGESWAKEVNTHEVIGNIYENPELLNNEVKMPNNNLTEREKEVLKLACFSNKEIARRLFIERCTVATHFSNMRVRLAPATTKSSMLIEGLRRKVINIDEIEIN